MGRRLCEAELATAPCGWRGKHDERNGVPVRPEGGRRSEQKSFVVAHHGLSPRRKNMSGVKRHVRAERKNDAYEHACEQRDDATVDAAAGFCEGSLFTLATRRQGFPAGS